MQRTRTFSGTTAVLGNLGSGDCKLWRNERPNSFQMEVFALVTASAFARVAHFYKKPHTVRIVCSASACK